MATSRRVPTAVRIAAILCLSALAGCDDPSQPRPGTVQDEAKRAGLTVADLTPATEDYFRDMDGGGALSAAEIQGRNTWLVWTAGNDRLWDTLSVASVGNLDFLKTLSSNPNLPYYSRDNRWRYLGLANEPCFEKATGPDRERFGLWLDKRKVSPDCPPDPFENEQKYPGVKVGARGTVVVDGKKVPVGSYYGYATGVVGLRLFPNPDFDQAAANKWDAVRYYNDPGYYLDKDLVRPYRVGMSCAFCHVGPNPVNPPPDPEHPEWKHLSSNVGAQYFWIDRIFIWDRKDVGGSFVHQVFATSRPGALDTSLVSTDNINNPRTMNAIYGLGARLAHAKRWGKETLAGGSANNKQFNDFVASGPLTQFFDAPATSWSPRVLKDGSDSVGALGALNRVFLNIGLFSEEWLLHFKPLIGGKETTPIEIAVARKNSVYWQATESQTPNLALFFLKTTAPHKLKDAPGGTAYLTRDAAQLERGKVVFAENCARCHSSKVPKTVPALDPLGGCSGSTYLQCFKRYWVQTKTDEFKRQMRDIVLAPDFLDDNFLSSELRIPVTYLHTNACSPLATNAIAGNIWDNFSSQTYKELEPVGKIRVYHPVTGEPMPYDMPGGGRGYTRPASLISVWSTAPFLLNNSLGHFEEMPSVEARMKAFDDAIEQLLWPEKRKRETVNGHVLPGYIDRTTEMSWLRVPAGYIPEPLRPLIGPLGNVAPWLARAGGIQIGPIPRGTPVNLLANLNLRPDGLSLGERLSYDAKVLKFLTDAKLDLSSLPPNASNEEAQKVFANLVERMLDLNKCKDFIVNRGHYFGTGYLEPGDPGPTEPGLSDADKRALIEFIKTF